MGSTLKENNERICFYDLIQWITSCHKNRMTTRVITLWRVYLTSLTTSVSTLRFLTEIMFILKAIKSHFKGSYDKQRYPRDTLVSQYDVSVESSSLNHHRLIRDFFVLC